MKDFYKPLENRTPDTQYQDRIKYILANGEMLENTAQGPGALTCFGTLAPMVFDLSNGAAIITERSMAGFWRQPLAEITGFVNGVHTIDGLNAYGCNFWDDYRGKGTLIGLDPNDLGPGSYGPAFHDFPMPDGGHLNQFEQLIDQIQKYPYMRSHRITPWIPFYTARGPNRKVQVAPCHGWLHYRVMNGKLHMRMDQYSADMPTGVPSNMTQYSALMLMVCQVTGYPPGNYIHSLGDAHIYANQIEAMRELVKRKPRPFPILKLDPTVTNLFDFRAKHFTLEEYDPYPAMKIPYSP